MYLAHNNRVHTHTQKKKNQLATYLHYYNFQVATLSSSFIGILNVAIISICYLYIPII